MSAGKVVLVTGASSGLGRAMAEHLSVVGHIVFGTSRKPAGNTGAVRMLALDVTDDASVQQAAAALMCWSTMQASACAEPSRTPVSTRHAGNSTPISLVSCA